MSLTSTIIEAGVFGFAKIPVVISGTLGAGNVLTASLRPGYSATGFQWTRNGSDISGQTASTYNQLITDRGSVIGCRAIGLAYSGSAGTVPIVVPSAPTELTATAGNASVSCSFTVPADNGGSVITGYRLSVYRASDNAYLGGANGSVSPLSLTGLTNDISVYMKVAAVNAVGVGPQSAASSTVTPTASVTITTFPYTLLPSDSGKTLLFQAAAGVDALVNIPSGLGASYTHIGQQIGDGFIIYNEVGATVTNSNGNRIKSSASQAEGIGSPMILGKGMSVTLTATSADTLVLSGQVGRYQNVVQHCGFPNSYGATLRQGLGRTLHPVVGGSNGLVIRALKLLYGNVYGPTEQVATADISIGGSFTFPASNTATPTPITFSGGSNYGTITGGAKNSILSDPCYLPTPIVVGSADALAGVALSIFQSGSGGIIYGNGRACAPGEYINFGTTAGTNMDLTKQAFNSWPGGANTGTGTGTPQAMMPLAIIAVTDTGSEIIISMSRDYGAGDVPDAPGGRKGETERAWKFRRAVMNFGAPSESMSGSWRNNASSSSFRRSLFKYGGKNIINGHGVNDLNFGTSAQIADLYNNLKTTCPEFAGRRQYVNTTVTSLISTTDYYVTTAGQAQQNPTNEARRVGLNSIIRGGTAGVDGYCEVADTVETARGSGVLKVNPRARILTTASISAGSNVLTDSAGSFTSDDNNLLVTLPMGSSGAMVTAVVRYVNANTCNLLIYQSMTAFNATTAIAAGTNVYFGSLDVFVDGGPGVYGNHESFRGGQMIESLAIPPTLPVG